MRALAAHGPVHAYLERQNHLDYWHTALFQQWVHALALLALYPLLTAIFPWLATAQVAGLPLTLLILGGGIYPPLVLLGYWYVRRAERLEQQFVELLKEQ